MGGFIVLLPIDAPPVAVLFLALSMSVAMDWAMGAAGINTIATLPVAMLRRPLLQSVCGKEGIREGGIPSSIRLGQGGFLRYLAAMVVVHHFLFFMLESLSWAQLFHTLVRLVVSSAFSQLFADLDAFFCLGKHQALLIAVHCNKFYAAYAGVDHTVYGVIAATAYTNYFNIGQRFKGCLYVIKHILRPP